MIKCDKFFLDKCPCSKPSMLVFEQGHLSRKNFASVNYLPIALVTENLSVSYIFHLHYQEKLVKEKLVEENLVVFTVETFSLTRGLVKENLPV